MSFPQFGKELHNDLGVFSNKEVLDRCFHPIHSFLLEIKTYMQLSSCLFFWEKMNDCDKVPFFKSIRPD